MAIPIPPQDPDGWHPIPFQDVLLGVDESAMQAFLAFQSAMDAHQELVLYDLSVGGTQPSHVTVLRMIATYEGVCQRELAELLSISRARVTTVLQCLEREKAIVRVRDKNDQRLTRVYLTDHGRQIDAGKEALRSKHIRAVFGSMNEEERAEVQRALSGVALRIRAVLDSYKGAAQTGAAQTDS